MEAEINTINNTEDMTPKWRRKVDFSLKKSRQLDQTENISQATEDFSYHDCRNQFWNPKKYSFLWGTWLWDQSSDDQKKALNQIYWVAYYSQIISAEIATIYFNQASAASLYSLSNFKSVCDTLDLESSQERTHINAFSKISSATEMEIFGQRIFSFEMRGPFDKTMLYSDLNSIKKWIRRWQLKVYPMLSADSPYIGSQYFTIRALRTLNGKIVQDQLSKMVRQPKVETIFSIPSQISYFHFMDESFHFNTSMVLSRDIIHSIPKPTAFEKLVSNIAIRGCQKDHFHFSTAVNGIFWFDPALFQDCYKMLRSQVFQMNHDEAMLAIEKSFCQESEGMVESQKTHHVARESYVNYLADAPDIWSSNKEMSIMKENNLQRHLKTNCAYFRNFKGTLNA